MRLVDLDPHWLVSRDANGYEQPGGRRIGITFLCPCGCRGTDRERRLWATFKNPIDGGEAEPDWPVYWQRSGETFEDLTLSPSIDASRFGHWHGFITNGEVR